jgi:hypothetical protein
MMSSQPDLFDPGVLLSAGSDETGPEPEGANDRAPSISALEKAPDTGVEGAQEGGQLARTLEANLKSKDLQESEVPHADPKVEGAELASKEPVAGAPAELPSPRRDPHHGDPERLDPESLTQAAEELTLERKAVAEEEGVIGLPVKREPVDGVLDDDEIEDELDPVTNGAGSFRPGASSAKTRLPAEEIEEVYFQPGVTDAEGQWLWVDPRYESGYTPLAFDLAEFLDRATRLFQTKSWTRGKKPGRLAVRPDRPDRDAQEANGLKSVAESAGLEVVYDPRVPPGTYWLGLAIDKEAQ